MLMCTRSHQRCTIWISVTNPPLSASSEPAQCHAKSPEWVGEREFMLDCETSSTWCGTIATVGLGQSGFRKTTVLIEFKYAKSAGHLMYFGHKEEKYSLFYFIIHTNKSYLLSTKGGINFLTIRWLQVTLRILSITIVSQRDFPLAWFRLSDSITKPICWALTANYAVWLQ